MPSATSRGSTSASFERGQRVLDLAIAGTMLVVCSPLFLVIATLIKVTSPGPVLYRGQRVGRNGRPFLLHKFRSMHLNADKVGPGVTGAGDQRVTPVGRWLRRFKLDEIPQLLNVLKGELSMVGPRPEDARYVAHYTAEQRRILSVRPGITSIASVRYRHEETLLRGQDWETTYLNVVMPEKLRMDLEYIDRRTLTSDLGVMLQTFLALLR